TGKGRTLKSLVHHQLHHMVAASTAFILRASSGRRLKTIERILSSEPAAVVRSVLKKRRETTINQCRRKTPETERKTMNSSSNQNQTSRAKALVPALLITALLALAGAALVRADLAANNLKTPRVFPPNASAFGKTYAQWSEAWW